jgi:hypothetical protein
MQTELHKLQTVPAPKLSRGADSDEGDQDSELIVISVPGSV